MDDDTFTAQLQELLKKVSELPPKQQAALEPLIEETRARQQLISADTASAIDAMDSLRLLCKYALFSLEAGQRERTQGQNGES